jgi:hypothetical protein
MDAGNNRDRDRRTPLALASISIDFGAKTDIYAAL